jgi:hypothetical protein
MRQKIAVWIASVFVAMGVLFVMVPSPAYAADFDPFKDACSTAKDSTVCKDSKSGANPIYGSDGIVATVVNILSIIIGVAAVIVIIIAGIQYMLSTGDPTKINNAKNAILYAIVGLVIAVMSQVIVRFIISRIG